MAGTQDFISRAALREEALSRRDDLESLCYMLIKIFKRELPWTGQTWEEMAKTKLNPDMFEQRCKKSQKKLLHTISNKPQTTKESC